MREGDPHNRKRTEEEEGLRGNHMHRAMEEKINSGGEGYQAEKQAAGLLGDRGERGTEGKALSTGSDNSEEESKPLVQRKALIGPRERVKRQSGS